MQLSVWKFGSTLRFAALISAMLLGAGCATNGRHVLLKEYGATAAPVAAQSLKGVTICIKPFDCATNLILPEPATKPEEPEQFTLVKFTSEETKTWAQELVALEKTKSPPKESLWEIGNLRNGFGMVMSHVYAVNDPGVWLADTLRMDLESQGIKVVDPSQAGSADICVSGTVQFCRVDSYMKIWGDLVVNLELKTKQGVASHKVLHTAGGTTEWVASATEFYKPLRECRQKFSWLATREISQALQQQATATQSAKQTSGEH